MRTRSNTRIEKICKYKPCGKTFFVTPCKNNGITLCRNCHSSVRHKEEELEAYFFLKLYNNRYKAINCFRRN